MNYKTLLEQVAKHVLSIFKEHSKHGLPYHNKAHTQFVVDSAIQIANHYQLDDKDFFIVIAAAWFHDVGYLHTIVDHEQEGVKMADAYLKSIGVHQDTIAHINQCIMATKMPQDPKDILGEIICDADLFHLGTDAFFEKYKLLRKELIEIKKIQISKQEWRQQTIELLEHQHYFTDYCNLLLNDKKNLNLEKLKKKVDENPDPAPGTSLAAAQLQPGEAAGRSEHEEHKKKNKDIPERGIETMFRITSSNSQRLSDMADRKAHILITVNSIILSAIISLVLRKLDTNSFLIIPTFMMLAVSVLCIIFSILATRPAIPRGVFSVEDIEDKKVNLLFFGNFYKMNLGDYSIGMEKVMADKDLLYNTLIMDVYAQGVVLGRKYQQLRIAYNIFMFGLIVAVIAFILAVVFHTDPVSPHLH